MYTTGTYQALYVFLLTTLLATAASAQGSPEGDEDNAEDTITTTARPEEHPGRANGVVTRDELKRRIPRSAPDALRYEPGVYIQQTAHSQGSPYIRGRTGQQTVLLFDGVRLNNSLFRMGPNQYFFTIDSQTIDHIEVLRGSASTRYSSDAIAGVISAHPVEPTLHDEGFHIRPTLLTRYSTADQETGGRLQLDMSLGENLGLVVGAGYRTVDFLESGGILYSPVGHEIPEVPRFDKDERTQLGTGFDEATADARLVWKLSPTLRAVLGWYEYRQFDAPRTDKCAPPEAPHDECLRYEEQFRTLLLARLEKRRGSGLMESGDLVLSYQKQHERRARERPLSFTFNGGRDDVHSFGARGYASTAYYALSDDLDLRASYGADLYHDRVSSTAWLTFTDVEITRFDPRGQYIDGSTYTWAGAFTEAEAIVADKVLLRAGGRTSWINADVDANEESLTQAVHQNWFAWVGNVGAEWWATPHLTLLANADQGFRAPNLDDLTSRQQTGPGFQYENADLGPERALTLEVGSRVRTDLLELDAWFYRSSLDEAIARAPRSSEDCPNSACRNSRSQFQLVNLDGEALIWGAEGSAKLHIMDNVSLRATLSWAWGDGPNPAERSDTSAQEYEPRVPLSRVPPLNGTVEALWRHSSGLYLGTSLRWATLQDRLALADVSDARIPRGGTPGFAVYDARAGYRFAPYGLLALVFENLTDEAYRYHGSSVNGPGRSLSAQLELSPF